MAHIWLVGKQEVIRFFLDSPLYVQWHAPPLAKLVQIGGTHPALPNHVSPERRPALPWWSHRVAVLLCPAAPPNAAANRSLIRESKAGWAGLYEGEVFVSASYGAFERTGIHC